MLLGTTHRSSVPNFSLVSISSGSNPKLTVLLVLPTYIAWLGMPSLYCRPRHIPVQYTCTSRVAKVESLKFQAVVNIGKSIKY